MTTTTVSQGSRRWAHQLDDLLDRWRLRKSEDEPESNITSQVARVKKITPHQRTRKFAVDGSVVQKLGELSLEDLATLRTELDTNNNALKEQINLFNIQARGQKDYAWLIEAKYIQSIYGALIQALQLESGRRRDERKKANLSKQVTQEMKEGSPASDIEAIYRVWRYARHIALGGQGDPPGWDAIDRVQLYLRENGIEA